MHQCQSEPRRVCGQDFGHVLYNQNGSQRKLEKQLKKERKIKKAITIKREIMEKYEGRVHVTDLANMHSMLESTMSTVLQRKDLYKKAGVAKSVAQISHP